MAIFIRFWALFLVISSTCYSQSISTLMGARSNGIGYASSSLFDHWGVFNNIAGIAKIEQTTTAFAYNVHPSLPGGDRIAAIITAPTNLGVLGGGIFRFGDGVYNESILSAGFSNQFGLAALGIKVNYIQYRAEGFGSKGVFTINFGGIAEITPSISVGAYITNINQPEISTDGDQLPTLLTAGMAFKPIDKLFFAVEIEKDLDFDATWKAGIEYQFHKKFCARTGFNLYPNAAFFGLGFKTNKFHFDYAFQQSSVLNIGHQASVNYLFIKK